MSDRRPGSAALLVAIVAAAVSFGTCFALVAAATRSSPRGAASTPPRHGAALPRLALGRAPALRDHTALLAPVVAPTPTPAPAPPPARAPAPAQPAAPAPSTSVPVQPVTTPAPTTATPPPQPAPVPRPAPKPTATQKRPQSFDDSGPPAPGTATPGATG